MKLGISKIICNEEFRGRKMTTPKKCIHYIKKYDQNTEI